MASQMAVSYSAAMAAMSGGPDVAAGDVAAVDTQDAPDKRGVLVVLNDLPALFCCQRSVDI
jgi:hypothetical protein